MKQDTALIRCQHLAELTGLRVTSYSKNGVQYFQFSTIKIVCTYRKARVFADGFVAGKRYEFLHKRTSILSKLSAAIKQAWGALWGAS